MGKGRKEAIIEILIILIIINIGIAFSYVIWFDVQWFLIIIFVTQIILNIFVIIAGIIVKYKIGNERFWNSPIICEGCNKEVESISRNILTGNLKWLCENCIKVS